MSTSTEPSKQDYPSKPIIDENGNLRIPFDSDPKYHHWKGGQGVLVTLKEIGAPPEIVRLYERKDALEATAQMPA